MKTKTRASDSSTRLRLARNDIIMKLFLKMLLNIYNAAMVVMLVITLVANHVLRQKKWTLARSPLDDDAEMSLDSSMRPAPSPAILEPRDR